MFYRLNSDGTRHDVPLEGLFAGPVPAACFLIGGGPSLAGLPVAGIAAAPVPKMSVNLAGARLLRPTFWTSYDPTRRFHRSIYLDPSVMKFVHRRRAMDLVPETTFKVCECPNLFFFEREGGRGFADFISPGARTIIDWADSMVQAIDILYRLGFRIVYLAGCEMRVRPSLLQIELAARAGVRYDPRRLLHDFVRDCEQAGLGFDELDAAGKARLYHFAESKPLRAAINTEKHYFRIAQALRLSRRSLSLAGLQLISVTPHSRLNDYFPYVPVRQVLRRIAGEIGDRRSEPAGGLYGRRDPRVPRPVGPMLDVRPHNWGPAGAGSRRWRPGSPAGRAVNANGRASRSIRDACGDPEILVEAEGYERIRGDRGAERAVTRLKAVRAGIDDVAEEG